MRPCETHPPAARILASSSGRSGLWSTERGIARPPRHRTARESPQLPTTMWVLVTRAAMAVAPAEEAVEVRYCSSVEWKALRIASPRSSGESRSPHRPPPAPPPAAEAAAPPSAAAAAVRLASSMLARWLVRWRWRWTFAKAEASGPAWPSYTA